MTDADIPQLIDAYGDEDALTQLRAIGAPVLGPLRDAYAALEPYDYITALWYDRILAAVAPDPVGTALALLDVAPERHTLELAWPLRRFLAPADRPRVVAALAQAVAWQPQTRSVTLPSDVLKIATLCEAVALLATGDDVPLLRAVLAAAEGEAGRYRKEGKFDFEVFGVNYLYVVAAAAAGLLACAERGHGPGERSRDRARWREAGADAALAAEIENSFTLHGANTPMPFLFTRAPAEATRVLDLIVKRAGDLPADPILSHIRFWILTATEQDVPLPALTGFDWLDRLAARAAADSYGPQCALDLRAMLQPERAVAEVMAVMTAADYRRKPLGHGADALEKARPLADVAAVVVEVRLSQCAIGGGKPEPGEDWYQDLNRRLRAVGLAPLDGWAWNAPEGDITGGQSLATLQATLCGIAHACAAAAQAPDALAAQAALGALNRLPVPMPALVRQSRNRNLLVALARAGARARAAIGTILEATLSVEEDVHVVAAAHTLIGQLAGDAAGPLYLALLAAPGTRKSANTARAVVASVTAAAPPGAGERVHAFAIAMGWEKERTAYGLGVTLAEAMGALGVEASVAKLVQEIGHSGLGSEAEVALLKLAARNPQLLDEATFSRALDEVLDDGFADKGPDLLGEQARAAVLRILRAEPPPSARLVQACRFLARTAPDGEPPPDALPLLLRALPGAVALAKQFPGEEWEDRNWGGYNASAYEDAADAMSSAILALCAGRYSPDARAAMLAELHAIDGLDLARVEMVASTSYSIAYPVRDLAALLGVHVAPHH